MKPAILILPLAVSLSACAQAVMTADADPCKQTAAADRLGGSAALLGSGTPLNFQYITRDEYNGSRIASDAARPADCIRIHNQTPRTYDLHKIGDGPVSSGTVLGSNDAQFSCLRREKA